MPSQAVSAVTGRRASKILVVVDERSMRQMLEIPLRREGYDVVTAEDGAAAVVLLETQPFDMLISDVRMPNASGVDVLRKAKEIDPGIIGIMITAFGSRESIQEVLRLEAADYLDKPFDVEELKFRVRKELERRRLAQENVLLKRALQSSHQFSNIIGRSEPMLAVLRFIETIASTNSPVLVTGESGTGKELENAIERAVALERTPAILPESLPEHIRIGQPARDGAARGDGLPENGFDLERHVREIEREYLAEALRRAGGVKVKAAKLVGMSFRSFRYYAKKYNL
jgi:DNA-binding NtrC family response regulator